MKIAFLIRSLDSGGAQTQLALLADALLHRGHDVSILTFYPGGLVSDELEKSGITPICLNKTGRWDIIGFSWRLVKALRTFKPDVVYSFLTTSNVLTVLIRPFIGPSRLIWGIRATNMDLKLYGRIDRLSDALEARLSHQVTAIICNANQGLEDAVQRGMPRHQLVHIPNAIDTTRFQPTTERRASLRHEWGIDENDFVIGMAARYDPMKGHDVFLAAARRIRAQHPHVRFVLAGRGTENIDEPGIIALGERADMQDVYPAWDIVCLSSLFGEGYPNAIGESMACAVPAIGTDVGDTADIIGETGWTVPPGNEDALCDAFNIALSHTAEDLRNCGIKARARIESLYSLDLLAKRTEAVLSHQNS